MTPPSGGSVRPYARALFDVALAQGELTAVAQDLRTAAALLEAHPDLRDILAHPALAGDRKKALWAAVWKSVRGGALVGRLLDLLVGRGRTPLLPAVEATFRDLWNSHRGVVAAEAVSAVPLDKAQAGALVEAIRKATGKDVELEATVDAALLGGLLVRMGGRTYDGSVRSRLRALRERLSRDRVEA